MRQQILLLTTLLVGSVLIGWWTYRPAPAPAAPEQAATVEPPQPEITPSVTPPPPKQSVSVKKSLFFGRMIPLVAQQNQNTLETRAAILRMRLIVQQGKPLPEEQQDSLRQLVKRYRIRTGASNELAQIALIDELLARVDMVPPSLALAQAATESAWGESRFAREANNLYGQWCFTPGCGLVPLQRPEGMSHEVASYPTWQASVTAYFLNLNSHPAYQPLRDIRLQLREQNRSLAGELLATGLEKYSARGSSYVKSLQQIIRVNDLVKLDEL